jgi:excisionase family DNA binding protein
MYDYSYAASHFVVTRGRTSSEDGSVTRQKFYNTVQAAHQLDISRDTLYRWLRERKIKGGKIVRLGASAAAQTQIRLWTERDLRQVRVWMRENYVARKAKRGSRG